MKPACSFYSWSKSLDLAWNESPAAQHGAGQARATQQAVGQCGGWTALGDAGWGQRYGTPILTSQTCTPKLHPRGVTKDSGGGPGPPSHIQTIKGPIARCAQGTCVPELITSHRAAGVGFRICCFAVLEWLFVCMLLASPICCRFSSVVQHFACPAAPVFSWPAFCSEEWSQGALFTFSLFLPPALYQSSDFLPSKE